MVSSPGATDSSCSPALPASADGSSTRRRDGLHGRWITPGLIDCHTHLIHARRTAAEFEQRLAGVSYEAIARAGGGILSHHERNSICEQGHLCALALPRLDALIAEGVTTIEIKSGYGLALEHEASS